MINKLVPNQKAIRIKKEKSGKENLYSIVNLAAQKEALKVLKPNTFKVWCWLNSNQDNYEFGLSGKVVQEECNISKGTYDTAIKELKEKNYLVESELYEGLKGYVFYEGGYSVGQKLSNEDTNLPPLDKNYPTVGQNLSNAVGQNLSNELVKNYPRNITNTTNNNIDRLQEQSSVLSERLEAIENQFSNGEAARKSFKQLLDSGKTEDWILPQETIVSDEKQTEKTECFPQETNNFPQETNNFPQETNNFPQETIVSHSTEEIDNNNNNNKIDSLEPTIVFSERLEKLVQQFTFVGARDSIQQLLSRGKTEEWIIAAIENKGVAYFNKYGKLGLLFTEPYQQEIDGLLFKKKREAAEIEYWRKAMFEQGSQNLVKLPTEIRVTKNSSISKPKNNRQRPPYDLNEIAKMA